MTWSTCRRSSSGSWRLRGGVLEYAKFEPALIRFADLMEQTFDRIRPELKSQFAEGP